MTEETRNIISAGDAVIDFIRTFDASLDFKVWLKLIQEEFIEVQQETKGTAAHLKEVADLVYVIAGFGITIAITPEVLISEKTLASIKEMSDNMRPVIDENINYYPTEILVKAFERVHASNMSKLDDNGEPIRREDGKILKGPNYKPPDLSDLI